MDPAFQRRVQRYGWDKAAAYYENFWQDQLKPAQDLMLELLKLQPREKVLDVASGTGLVSFRAKQQVGADGYVFGTDISEKMVAISNDIAKEKDLRNIQFERMDAEDLQVPDQEFDAAMCALGLMYVPDPLKALKEMYRALKTGGRAAAAVWGQRDHCGWSGTFDIIDRRVTSEVCPMFFNLGNPNQLSLYFKVAGYSSITSKKISTKLYYESAEEACGAAFPGGPMALAYNKFSDAVKDEVHAEYLESIDKYKNGNGYELPGEFVVAIGRKLEP
ncbi:MAG: methyltransferase domain-containing protein [Bacteroidetes bacterium]|nr:methyltransferase domain-containing protein [Bacteroidota bacterium]